jgi:hypothetical protein
MRFLPLLLGGVFLAAVSGCSTFNKFDIRKAQVSTPAGTLAVAVAGVDERESLKRGEISPDYLGMTRDGVGIPYKVKTATKRPLSLEVAEVVTTGFRNAGRQTFPAMTQPSSSAAVGALRMSKANRLVVVRIQKWESDTLINTSLYYAITVEVYDSAGKLLASASEAKEQALGGNYFVAAMHANQAVLAEMGKIMSRLLASPNVAASLRG